MNINTIVNDMPYGYRWALEDEVEAVLNGDDPHFREVSVQVRRGGTDEDPITDIAIQWDCMQELGMDHEHDAEACEHFMAGMSPEYPDPYGSDDIEYNNYMYGSSRY